MGRLAKGTKPSTKPQSPVLTIFKFFGVLGHPKRDSGRQPNPSPTWGFYDNKGPLIKDPNKIPLISNPHNLPHLKSVTGAPVVRLPKLLRDGERLRVPGVLEYTCL